MSKHGSGGIPLDDGHDKNESGNVNLDEVKPIDNGITEIRHKLEEIDKDIEKDENTKLLESRKIIRDIVDRDPNDLKPHDINHVLYGDEDVDLTLVDSILQKGQLEPIVITDDNIIISGHRRWLALKYINDNELQIQVRNENDSTDYKSEAFIEMQVRCVVVHFDNEKSKILAIIDYNKRREKRSSQYYQEIKHLHTIYDTEALQKIKSNLKNNPNQYVDLTDLSKRKKKDYRKENPGINDAEIIDKLHKSGEIKEEDIIKGKMYEDAKKEALDTYQTIANGIDKNRTFTFRLDQIGKSAEENDEVAQESMKYLDSKTWKLNNAYNVHRLRNIQMKNQSNGKLYETIQKEIEEVLNDAKEAKAEAEAKALRAKNKVSEEKGSKVKTRRKFINDKKVRDYEDFAKVTDQDMKTKNQPKYSVVLIEPKDDFDTYTISKLSSFTNSALFVIADQGNLIECVNLMTKHHYSYTTFYGYDDRLLLLGVRAYDNPLVTISVIKNRKELYERIRAFYPKETSFHEVDNQNKSTDEPYGWEIPIDRKESARSERERNAKSKSKKSSAESATA